MKAPAIMIVLLGLAACSSSNVPANYCILAQCEQQADTGNGNLDEGNQDAEVDVGL